MKISFKLILPAISLAVLLSCANTADNPPEDEDTTAPTLLATQDPIEPESTTWKIRFNEALTLAAADNTVLAAGITYTINSGSAVAVQSASIDAADSTVINIEFTGTLALDDSVVISIAANMVQDAAGNKNAAESITKIVINNAVLPYLLDASSQNELGDADTSYTLQFNTALTLSVADNAALAAGITYTVNGGTPIAVATATINGNDVEVTFATPFTAGDEVVFTIAADMVQDAAGNKNAAASLNAITVTDATPPKLLPQAQQDGLDSNQTSYIIRFSEELTLVNTEAALTAGITFSTDGGTTSTAVNSASIDSTDASLITITFASSFAANASVDISIAANLVKDSADNKNAAESITGIVIKNAALPYLLDASAQNELGDADTSYTLQFNTALTLSAADNAALAAGITYTVNGGTSSAVATATISGNNVEVTFAAPFTAGDDVVFTIAAGLVENSGNSNAANTLTLTITDNTPPTFDASQNTLDDIMETFKLKFTEELSRAAADDTALAAGITYTVNSGNAMAVQSASIDAVDSTVINIEFPRFTGGASVVFSIAADMVQDAAGNKNAAASLSAITVTDTPPTLRAEQDTIRELDRDYKLRFNQNLVLNAADNTALAAGITVRVDSGTATPVTSAEIDSTDASIINIKIPLLVYPTQQVTISIAADLVKDTTNNNAGAGSFGKTVENQVSQAVRTIEDNMGGSGIAVDNDGMLYIADPCGADYGTLSLGLLKVDKNGTVTNVSADFWATTIIFHNNALYAAQTDSKIVKLTPNADKTAFTPADITSGGNGFEDGAAATAQFEWVQGLAIDSSGNIYVADTDNHRIRKIASGTYTVSTIAGNGTGEFADGVGTAAKYNSPRGIAVDSAGIIYVADTNNHRIRKLTPGTNGYTSSTIAGTGTAGYVDGAGGTAQFNKPSSLVLDKAGNIFVADYSNYRIRMLSPNADKSAWTVSTFAGDGNQNNTDGIGVEASLSYMTLTIDADDNMYVVGDGHIRKVFR
ncbi:MAG: hypothetical protein B0D92_02100 [Spirochaeta sp. LUC14_002_19_P3]|nr:MAG: hypothetical protein B0D92_02100 [Spirochaeta sp. LUC14_002_19_P3]